MPVWQRDIVGELFTEEKEIINDIRGSFDYRMERLTKYRLDHLSEQCTKSGVVDQSSLFDAEAAMRSGRFENRPRFLVSDQHKVIYCSVDGAGEEFLERTIERMELGHGKNEEEFDHRFDRSDGHR